ncbi:terminase [Streptomyces sp. 769]|uniref:terminase n=1 Tax=Streptomyces sp. 769 TaxID=1262452 RepID=UPI000581E9DB|nr:terminase [Streptomyces sp. 769]AJC60152.1 prophage terminase large subunit [Streptomyces sp. 769]
MSRAYVASLAAEYVGLWKRRMIDGAWCVAEGAVYDMWDEQQHVVDSLPAMRRLWLGIDYGTTNATSAVLLGLGDDDRLYAVAEWRHDSRQTRRQMTDAQYSAAIRRWLAEQQVEPEWTFVDPSAASFSTQLWTDGHPGIARARNEVLDGIRSVSTALDSGLLRVHSSCSGLLAELPGYSWDPAASDRGEDRPLKRDDHSCDALRYVTHSTVHEWRGLVQAT